MTGLPAEVRVGEPAARRPLVREKRAQAQQEVLDKYWVDYRAVLARPGCGIKCKSGVKGLFSG